MKLAAGIFIVFVGVLGSSRADASEYVFTLIADTSTRFSQVGSGPAINGAGQVVFRGDLVDGTQGLFRGTGGPIETLLVGTEIGVPGVKHDQIALQIDDAIVRVNSQGLTTIADTSGEIGRFVFPTPPSINSDGVTTFQAFFKISEGQKQAIFVGDGVSLTPIVHANCGPVFLELNPPHINDSGEVAFLGLLDSGTLGDCFGSVLGIFKYSDDVVATVVDTRGQYASFSDPVINDAGTVAFIASRDDAGGSPIHGYDMVVVDSNGNSTVVASAISNAGQPALNNEGQVALIADSEQGRTVFTGVSSLSPVIAVGTELFGATVVDMSMYKYAINDLGQIVFNAYLSDGRGPIVRADPVLPISIDVLDHQINLKRRDGDVRVALLSTTDFDAIQKVDTKTLTFGRTGVEASAVGCSARDVNHDGLLDLVCEFDVTEIGLQPGDTVASVQGRTTEGLFLRGSDTVKTK